MSYNRPGSFDFIGKYRYQLRAGYHWSKGDNLRDCTSGYWNCEYFKCWNNFFFATD